MEPEVLSQLRPILADRQEVHRAMSEVQCRSTEVLLLAGRALLVLPQLGHAW